MIFPHLPGLRRVHFVGIGGVGMSAIAELLLDFDLEISGSDLSRSATTERLERLGARVFEGHRASQVEGADLVVVSSAVDQDNVEIKEARRAGLMVARRAEILAEMMRLKYGVAVAGTHGKTTTTSLVGTLLTEAGQDPTVIVGGQLRVSGTGARHGGGSVMVAEADEFDRSFLRLSPILAVITNIDEDHLDTYRDLADIENAFVEFASRVPFFGQVIACGDDPGVQAILPRLADRRVVTYGLRSSSELVAERVELLPEGARFEVRHAQEGSLGPLELPMPGEHNVLNALAAIAVARALDVDFSVVRSAFSSFAGVHRRFERLGQWLGAAVVDDYAHHPAEVRATLRAARQAYASGTVHAVFQPHLFSRTRDHADDFGAALLGADQALVTDIYAAREAPIAGVTADLIVEAARAHGHRRVRRCHGWQEAPDLLRSAVNVGDVVVTLGAGDIFRLGRLLVEEGGS